MKWLSERAAAALHRRTPHGVRGLKSEWEHGEEIAAQSHPAWGAWIEMRVVGRTAQILSSHPAWGAWIEINRAASKCYFCRVAPRMGCVD